MFRKGALLAFAILSVGISTLSFANDRLGVSDYAFEKKAIFNTRSGSAGFVLDQEALQSISENFGNFIVLDEENQEVDFKVFFENPHRVKNTKLVQVSSALRGDPRYLLDDDIFTHFVFDEKVDKRDPSWVVIDLGEPTIVNRAKIFVPEVARIRDIEILGGNSLDNMEKILQKKPFNWITDFSLNEPVRYLKINFGGLRVAVDEIELFAPRNGIVYLDASVKSPARFLYGGTAANKIVYSERFGKRQSVNQFGRLTKQAWNPAAPEDFDDDSILNSEDNCPFIENSSQRDSDDDRIGNACDNAPEVKNINQLDTDMDGVGDIIDNCKFTENPDQGDRDSDGYGNACDSAHATDPEKKDSILKYLSFGGIALVLLIVGFISARMVASKNKNEPSKND